MSDVDIGAELRGHLIGITAISDLVGSRVYPDALPQDSALPAIVYHQILEDFETFVSGDLAQLSRAVLQIEAHADTRLVANSLARLIRDPAVGIIGYRGAWGDATIDTVEIWSGGVRYDTTPPAPGTDSRIYIAATDLKITYLSS